MDGHGYLAFLGCGCPTRSHCRAVPAYDRGMVQLKGIHDPMQVYSLIKPASGKKKGFSRYRSVL